MTDLLIYGTGGMGREVAQLALDLNADGAAVRVAGFLSDDAGVHDTEIAGIPVLGGATYLAQRPGRFDVTLAVGAPAVKRRLAAQSASVVRSFPTLVHPTVVRSGRVRIGQGSVICAGTVLTVDIAVGDFATVNVACTISHDAVLADYVTLAPGVSICGNVFIGEGCDFGTGAKVIHGRHIGEWAIVGAGATVCGDLPANCTAVGVPARPIKHREPGWQLGLRR